MHIRKRLAPPALVLAILAALAVAPGHVSAQGPAMLFQGSASSPLRVADAGATVIRSRRSTVRFDRLSTAMARGLAGDRAPLLTVNLFDDLALPVVFERHESDAIGHQSWTGRVDGFPLSTVSLTWKGDVLSGSVQLEDAVYRIGASGGLATIEQLDPATFPPEMPPLLPPASEMVHPADHDVLRPAAGEVVDIFVYYTTAARVGAGGAAAIQALIAQGIADSNTAFARSGIQASKWLVGTGELAEFVQTDDMQADLRTFTNAPAVAATRNAVGADLMHLVLNDTTEFCGVAWLGPSSTYAHGVSARGCFAQYTFTHEVGHNFGNNHAPEDYSAPPATVFRPYSFGYKNCAGPSRFRTIMAYACSGVYAARLLNLSNPGVPYSGLPTGTATQNNALSQSLAFPIVQGFRTAAAALPSAPRNLQATIADNQITLEWQPPAVGAPIASYIVQAGTAPGLSNVYNGAVGALPSVSSPIGNGTYHIRVLARNALGVGPATADVTVSVGSPPGPPRGLAASVSGSTIDLRWSPPAGGAALSTYIVQAGTGTGLANVFNAGVGTGTSVRGAVPPGTYFLRVLAQGAGGTSMASNEVTATVQSSCTVPSPPALTGGRSGSTVTIRWTASSGGPVTSYTVQAGSVSGQSNFFNASVGLTDTVSAAVAPGNYFVRVVANAVCGSSAASNEVLLTVP